MKKISYLFVMIVLSVVITTVGCKKKTDDNTSTKDQYVGTWQGTINFVSIDESYTEQATITIRLSGENILGYLIIHDEFNVDRLRLIIFENGVYSFAIVCSDPGHEDCEKWDVKGTLTLSETNVLQLNVSGMFCGQNGGKQGTLTGDLSKTSSTPDDSNFFTFAQVGREWHYRVTGYDGGECLMKFHLNEDLGNGIFTGIMTNDACGWEQRQYCWYVSPAQWCDMENVYLDSRIVNIQADAKVGDVYYSALPNDTITMTVLSLNDPVIIDGKTYSCMKIKRQGVLYGKHFDGYIWVTFETGLIKYEQILPNQTGDVHLEELIWKNF
ncbi:hypothetical protein ACFLS7_01850 [Bacteroidota bacterium]